MVVAQRALQREAIDRPLILRVEARPASPRAFTLYGVDVLVIEIGKNAGRERDRWYAETLAVDVHLAVVAPVVALVSELHAVRTGDVRRRRVPRACRASCCSTSSASGSASPA